MNSERERKRAQDALNKATTVEKQGDAELKKSYRSYVEALGAAIVMNGLGQALATERAAAGRDEDSAHLKLYENVGGWLVETVYSGERDILEAITKGDQERYLRAQTEALAWLAWHKKFCQAYLPKGSGDRR